jgi:hypothetical protein
MIDIDDNDSVHDPYEGCKVVNIPKAMNDHDSCYYTIPRHSLRETNMASWKIQYKWRSLAEKINELNDVFSSKPWS